jgi:hypothetical protein
VAAGLAIPGGDARGEGLSLYLEPAFTMTTVETRDQLGTTTTQDSRSLTQNYRVSFGRALGPSLDLQAGGQLENRQAQSDAGLGWTTSEATTRGLYGRLTLSLPALASGLSYDRSTATSPHAPTLVNENLAGHLRWFPLDLPELTLRMGWTHQYDMAQAIQDLTTVGALLSARYRVNSVEAKYALAWSQPRDAISGTETSSIQQTAQATYSDRLFDDRTTVYASVTLRNETTRTLVVGAGSVSLQQYPIGGLSLLELFPAQPTDDSLLPNPALVDGILTASAALDIGYTPTLAGDANLRDVGVQFGDLLTSVNTVRIWVDRKLTPEVAAAYAWSAYQSDDNRSWVPVPITGPVVFGPFQNRFEIPIRETRTRYLKVTTRPLQTGVTTDPAFASVLVTELQVFLETAASALPRDLASSSAQASVSATTQLWRAANLSWDLNGLFERRLTPTATIWSFLNGLSANQKLAKMLRLSERLARQDGDYGIGPFSQTDWSAALQWTPLPTFTGSLVYSGQLVDSLPGRDLTSGGRAIRTSRIGNTFASLARADLYEGISAQANAAWAFESQSDGRAKWGGTANATATLTPNPYATLTFGWLSSFSTVTDPLAQTTRTTSSRLDASLTFRPTSVLSAVGTVSRILSGVRPTTTGSAQVNYSPLRGDLQLSLAYSKTFDTASQAGIEFFTPALRWNVRQGVQLTASYSLLNTISPVSQTRSRSLGSVLTINL